ncbi:MAG: ABC transporter ATP-binding protein/permease [Lachnospiraceae bacterium]|nr:ABC transporter ATP-binding protein/permease [Lachnospiraceae bacterium]
MYKTRDKIKWIWTNMEGFHAIYILGMIGTVIYNVLQLVVPFFSGKMIDMYLTGEDAVYNMEHHRNFFFILLGVMVGATFLRTIIVYVSCMAYEKGSQKVLYKVRSFLFEKILRQDMRFYSKYRTGDLMTRVTGDLDAVRHMIAWVIRAVIESFSLVMATAVYFFIMDWRVALAILSISPVIAIIIAQFKKHVAPRHKMLRERLAELNTDAQENIAGNRVVKAFAREEYEKEKFDKSSRAYAEQNEKTALTWLSYFPYVETLANMLPSILLLTGGIFMIAGTMTMGEYVAFSGLTWAISNPMRQVGNVMNEFQRFQAASDKVLEIYYSEATITDRPDAKDLTERFQGEIVFDHVSFAYPDEEAVAPVLRDISFTIKPGETLAIMGETGCGKTSLIQLIPRFYDPYEGRILIDGEDIKSFKLTDLRHQIGLATQDVLLYSDTIDGNIAYGDVDMPEKDVLKYAKYSAANGFIKAMPEGYDTIIGERGVGLSGGQKQRISLARALAIRPSILILDDTTSAVDLETEKQIQEGLANLDFPCTKIMIAQRISTTKNADHIMILKDGKILEMGNHEELIRQNGYYADLVRLQLGEEVLASMLAGKEGK